MSEHRYDIRISEAVLIRTVKGRKTGPRQLSPLADAGKVRIGNSRIWKFGSLLLNTRPIGPSVTKHIRHITNKVTAD